MSIQDIERPQRAAHTVHGRVQQRSQRLNRRYLRYKPAAEGQNHHSPQQHATKQSSSVTTPTTLAKKISNNDTQLRVNIHTKQPVAAQSTPRPPRKASMDFIPKQPAAQPLPTKPYTPPKAVQNPQRSQVTPLPKKNPITSQKTHPIEASIKKTALPTTEQRIHSYKKKTEHIIQPAKTAHPQSTRKQVEAPRHPVAQKNLDVRTAKPSKALRDHVINEAITKAPKPNHREHKRTKQKNKGLFHNFGHKVGITFAGMAVLVLGAYFTYLNMPNLSIRMAAAQSGVNNASYPGYRPSGYSLNGPIAYNNGEVRMKFAANTGPTSFAITQTKTSWDSTALLDNLVTPNSDNKYVTNRYNGLTLYTFDTTTTWVNNGILYTISGDAALSNEQIQRIALSM